MSIYPRISGHVGTTRGIRAFYPFGAQRPLGTPGVVMGMELNGGAGFVYDPWFLRRAGIISGPNLALMGLIGSRKSGCAKTYALRQIAHRNRRVWIFDKKPEYAAMAEAAGGTVIPLRPGGRVRLNPLDALIVESDPERIRGARIALLEALIGSVLGREVSPPESTALDVTLDLVVERTGASPTLTDVAEALLYPQEFPDAAHRAAMERDEFRQTTRVIAHALRKLVYGKLRGMFDGPTSGDVDLERPVVVFDLSALDEDALGIVMVCLFAWLRRRLSEVGSERPSEEDPLDMRTILIWDEAWRVMSLPGAVSFMREAWKMARQWGLQNIAIVHALNDFLSAVSPDVRDAAMGLLKDSETKVIYRQDPSERAHLAEMGLNEAEIEVASQALPGHGIWKIGVDRSYLVDNVAGPAELPLLDSSSREVA